jgi:hypothetical protein
MKKLKIKVITNAKRNAVVNGGKVQKYIYR